MYRDTSKDSGAARPMRMVGFDIFAPTSKQIRDCKVWAENWQSVMFFSNYCGTQWRYASGMGGVVSTGLDHTAVLANLRTLRLPRARADEIYADVRLMERAAMGAMAR